MAKMLVTVSFDFNLRKGEYSGYTVEQAKKVEARILRRLLNGALSGGEYDLCEPDMMDIELEVEDDNGKAVFDNETL